MQAIPWSEILISTFKRSNTDKQRLFIWLQFPSSIKNPSNKFLNTCQHIKTLHSQQKPQRKSATDTNKVFTSIVNIQYGIHNILNIFKAFVAKLFLKSVFR